MKLSNLFHLNWCATIALNRKAGGWKSAFRMPIKVYGPLRWHIGGSIVLPDNAMRNTLIIGSEHEDYTAPAGRAELRIDGRMVVNGIVRIGHDAFIGVAKGASMSIGDGSFIGRDSQIHCSGSVTIGRDVFCGETYISDSSEHQIVAGGTKKEMVGSVTIGNGTYMGFRTMLLKDTNIPPRSVVASGAVCTKDFSGDGVEKKMIAGVPATIVADDVYAIK